MQSTSALYKTIISGSHYYESKILIKNVEYGIDKVQDIQITRNMFSDNSCCIGSVCSAEITVKLLVPSASIPRMATLKPYVRACSRNSSDKSEWLQQGVFYIDTREVNDDVLTIHGYDDLLKTEQVMFTSSGSQGQWPMVDTDVVYEICTRIGVTQDSRNSLTLGYQVPYPSYGEQGYTLREVLGQIATAYCGNWIMTEVGELRLVRLNDLPTETNLIITSLNEPITFGGDAILWQ